jgi:hypothetical protein
MSEERDGRRWRINKDPTIFGGQGMVHGPDTYGVVTVMPVGDGGEGATTRAGDLMQSALSRLLEWYFHLNEDPVPYEVRMAALEGKGAVEDWTSARAALGVSQSVQPTEGGPADPPEGDPTQRGESTT